MEPRVSATLILDQIRLIKDLHGEAFVVEALAALLCEWKAKQKQAASP